MNDNEDEQPFALTPEQIARMKRAFRWKMIAGILVGVIGAGASMLSCAGQSFSLRQARALESIDQHLSAIEQQLRR